VQPSGISQHPADRLIRALIATGRLATPGEITQIVARMAAAPFDPRLRPVPAKLRGATYQARTLGAREPAVLRHLVQRVVEDRQWVDGTDEAEYAADLQQAVRDSTARLVVYIRHGGPMAGALSRTARVLPASRLGPDALPWLFVAYSADRGMIVSGYQASGVHTLSLPEDIRWLR
jgi:hypothetical protein